MSMFQEVPCDVLAHNLSSIETGEITWDVRGHVGLAAQQRFFCHAGLSILVCQTK